MRSFAAALPDENMTLNDFFLKSITSYLNHEPCHAEIPGDFSWEALRVLSVEQQLLPFVYTSLQDQLPGEVRALWRREVMLSIASQVRRNAIFLDTYRALSEMGFSPLVVKGILCRQTYPKPDERSSSDEDLYVPLEEYPAFHKVLLDLGYKADEPDYKNAHEGRYYKGDFVLEGHWELFPQENKALNVLNQLNSGFWERSRFQEIDGVRLRVLDPTDHMTFLLLHAFKHFVNSGVGVRQICDVARWSLSYEIEWERVRQAMVLIHAEVFAGAVMDAAQKYFGMIPPTAWSLEDSSALLEDALKGGVYGNNTMKRKYSGGITLSAMEATEKRSRFHAVLRAVFPLRTVMELKYPWVKKSVLLLPAAWIARIVSYLLRGNDKDAAETVRIGSERMKLLKQYKIL